MKSKFKGIKTKQTISHQNRSIYMQIKYYNNICTDQIPKSPIKNNKNIKKRFNIRKNRQ